MDLSQQTKPYPRYLYHRDFNEPKIVNSKVEEIALGTKGWGVSYIHKDYPKWVGDKIVRSKEEEERLLVSEQPGPVEILEDEAFDMLGVEIMEGPPVVKEIQVDGRDTVVVEKPKRGRPPNKK